jgi:hypothetical protein
MTVAGSLLITVSALLFHFIPIVIDDFAKAEMRLTHPSSAMYHGFQNASSVTDIYYSFYMYNLTNADDVVNGAEAILQEVGPYVYLSVEFIDPDTIKWHPNATLEFSYVGCTVFQPSMSGGLTEEDVFITPNLGWIGALKAGLGELANEAAAQVNATMFMPLSFKQILWGYNNSVLQQLQTKDSLFFLNPFVRVMSNSPPSEQLTATTPTMQWSGGDAAYNEPPSQQEQTLTMWAGLTELVDPLLGPYWGSEYANQINGTLGNSYYTGMSLNGKYQVFVDDLYRSVLLSATRSLIYQGAELYRFTIDGSSFVSQQINPDNTAFYVEDTGFLARPPLKAEPIWISKARFLHANESAIHVKILPEVDVKANWEDYDVAIDIEPITGQVFQAHKRYQINTRFVQGVTVPPTLPKLLETYYPLLWIDYHTALPRHETDKFVNSVAIPKKAVKISSIVGMSAGSLLIIAAIALVLRRKQQVDVTDDAPNSLEGHAGTSRRTINDKEEDGVDGAKRISLIKYT